MTDTPTKGDAGLTPAERELLGQAMGYLTKPLQFDTGKLSETRGVARKTITNQWGVIRKKMDDPSVQLSETEMAFLKDAGQCLTSSPQIDTKKLAEHRGKALKTISNQWGSLKKKLFPEGLTAVKDSPDTPNTKGSRKRAAAGENGSANGDASPLAHKKPKTTKANPATPAVEPEPANMGDEEEDNLGQIKPETDLDSGAI